MGNVFSCVKYKVIRSMAGDSKVLRLDSADDDSTLTISHKVKDTEALVQRYKSLFNQDRFSDIILQVEDQRFYAHRFVLIAASNVFQMMLSQHHWKESSQLEISLTEEEECIPHFENFLRYLYSGEVELRTMTVLPLLLLADKYEVDSLQSSCLAFMVEHIVQAPNTSRVLTWYQYAQATWHTELQEKCLNFILSNFDTVMHASDWPCMLPLELASFLQCSDMVVGSEAELWANVEKWLLHHNNKDQLQENLRLILPHVRFTMMSPKELLNVENSSLYLDNKDLFSGKISQAYRALSLALIPADEPASLSSVASSIDSDASVIARLGHEPYRNYTSCLYQMFSSFQLKDFVNISKVDSRIPMEVKAAHRFISPERQHPGDLTLFSGYFFPKGFFKTITLYGSYMSQQNNDLTLKVSRRRMDLEPMKVNVTLLLQGKKHNMVYAAFSHNWTFVFTKENHTMTAEKFLSACCLADSNSPYLVDGALQGYLFLKIQDVGFHLLEQSKVKEK